MSFAMFSLLVFLLFASPSSCALLGTNDSNAVITRNYTSLSAFFASCKPAENVNEMSFCMKPPVLAVDKSFLEGTWIHLSTAGIGTPLYHRRCATTTFKKRYIHDSFVVSSCGQKNRRSYVMCMKGNATALPKEEGRIKVDMGPITEEIRNDITWHIAGAIGDDSFGYVGLAIYMCLKIRGGGGQVNGFLFLSRLGMHRGIEARLKLQLLCQGYDLRLPYEKTNHTNCRYRFGF